MSEDLLRQRRNLMVISLMIIILGYGGVQIEELGALGTRLKFTDKDALYVGLWVVFLYLNLRYYQYFKQEDLGISKAYIARIDNRMHKSLVREAAKQYDMKLDEVSGTFSYSKLKKISTFERAGHINVKENLYGDSTKPGYRVNILNYLHIFLVTFAHLTFNRTFVTDYYLPFMLSALAIYFGFTSNWEGNLCTLSGTEDTLQTICP